MPILRYFSGDTATLILFTVVAAVFLQVSRVVSVVAPSTGCYALDNSSRLHDFGSWIGHPFEYEGKDADLVIQFCKDVDSRSQAFGAKKALTKFQGE